MVESAPSGQFACANCGTPLKGEFCYQCGQKVIEARERTIRHFIYQFFGYAFFLENNFFRNLWYLLSKPGFLAKEYVSGRRKKYMAPLSLFLLINLFYFIFNPLTDLNLSLTDQINQPHHGSLAIRMVENRLTERGVEFGDYSEVYSQQSSTLTKTLIILNVPILALFIMLLYLSKRYFFSDHLFFSLYFFSCVLLFSMLVYLVIVISVKLFGVQSALAWRVTGVIQLIYYPVYLFLAAKRFYEQNYLWTALKTIGIVWAFVITHFIYRTLLFLIVFWTT